MFEGYLDRYLYRVCIVRISAPATMLAFAFSLVLSLSLHVYLSIALSPTLIPFHPLSPTLSPYICSHTQVGVPFALTVDFQTVQDRTVTIRERDSTLQVRND